MEQKHSKYEAFVEEARKLIYDGRDFKGKTYAEKIDFLESVSHDIYVRRKEMDFESVLEMQVYEFVSWAVDEEISQTKQEALKLPIKNENNGGNQIERRNARTFGNL